MNATMIKEELAKKDVTFDDFTREALTIQEKRKDFIVRNVAANMRLTCDGKLNFNCMENFKPKTYTLPLSSWALSQLSSKLGMPSGYAEKCINNNHAYLAAENINTWLTEQRGNVRKKSTNYLVRIHNGEVDGILSESYTAYDSDKILNTLKNVLEVDDYHVVGSYISNERMHLRLIKDNMLDVEGEDLYPAIFIDSSDVGRTALKITFGIWKKVCTNGLCISKIGGVLYHQRHVGISSVDLEAKMIARLKEVPILIKKAEEVIKNAKEEKIDLKNEEVFNKLVAEIRNTSKISEDDAKKVIELAQSKYSSTKWGIVNGMTELAQKFELDERIRVENAAGLLIA